MICRVKSGGAERGVPDELGKRANASIESRLGRPCKGFLRHSGRHDALHLGSGRSDGARGIRPYVCRICEALPHARILRDRRSVSVTDNQPRDWRTFVDRKSCSFRLFLSSLVLDPVDSQMDSQRRPDRRTGRGSFGWEFPLRDTNLERCAFSSSVGAGVLRNCQDA